MAKRRKDLERLPVSFPENFIGSKLVPILKVENRAQTLYYKKIETGATAQKGRTNGTTLTNRVLVDANDDFTLTKTEDRALVPIELKDEHGQKYVDTLGGTSVKTTLAETYETDIATLHLGGGGHVDVAATYGNSIIKAVKGEEHNIKRVAGDKVFVTNEKTYNIIMDKLEVTKRLSFTGVAAQNGEVIRGLAPQVLAEILGVKAVLVGDDEFWNVGDTHTGKAAILKVAPQGLDKMKINLKPYGNVMLQLNYADGENPWQINSWYNDPDQGYQFDAKGYDTIQTLNAEYIVKFNNITAD